MKRSLVTICAVLIVIFTLTGCISIYGEGYVPDEQKQEQAQEQEAEVPAEDTIPCAMEYVGQCGDWYYYRDVVTDVMYLWAEGSNGKGGLTVMMDPDTGLPLTYENYVDMAT